MSDPFGLMKFAECEHGSLRCEKCGARSDIRGWQTFTGQDKELLQLSEDNERLAAAEDLIAHLRISEAGWIDENKQTKQRLAAAEAAARFYAKWYDGPAEALLGEEDRRAFMWIEENGGEA